MKTIALLGNPNCGKSSVFNLLTGLRQHTGNFPGVTVEQRSGRCVPPRGQAFRVVDFPGTYNLYPTSKDEQVVFDVLTHRDHPDFPDLVLYVLDATHIDQHLLLLSQVRDLGLPAVIGLNMVDRAEKSGLKVDIPLLADALNLRVIPINGQNGNGIPDLILALQKTLEANKKDFYNPIEYQPADQINDLVHSIKTYLPAVASAYSALIVAHHYATLTWLKDDQKDHIEDQVHRSGFNTLQFQYEEIMTRYNIIDDIVNRCVKREEIKRNDHTRSIDKVVTHPIAGPMIFFGILMVIFQSVFAWSEKPMEWIEWLFNTTGHQVRYILGSGWLSSLLVDGVLAGLGGVLVFIPQIAFLFLLITMLEESGYMARAVYLFDRIMQRFGLNGRSLVALVSGTACAIPAIMSTRTISSHRERLTTIMVTPFISCSARLPVYALLVGMMVPKGFWLGVLSYQGLVFTGLYMLGGLTALLAAIIIHRRIKTGEQSHLMISLPDYQWPRIQNVLIVVWTKVASFVREAGKIIIIISVVLWFLASFGMPGKMDDAVQTATAIAKQAGMDEQEISDRIAAAKLEASFAGQLGKSIEPLIEPMGFDWKVGIALITSFAAREVFVGTMATIYSMGSSDDDSARIRDRMHEEVHPVSGKKIYNFGMMLSLLLFYVFAMQCMSTLAVVRKETGSWRWPIIQFLMMTGLAYVVSLSVYQGWLMLSGH